MMTLWLGLIHGGEAEEEVEWRDEFKSRMTSIGSEIKRSNEG